ncbi:lysosomal dipeptide transporter MFSD1-like [Argopecten irradians]|uniref:lysosomal dipeptide transporter MFSD1-like n=1 Tax=Argopecten irradians TaxID=31199 RepID=UPI00371AE188
MKPEQWRWRKVVLFLDGVFVIGIYFFIDIPSALQVEFVSDEVMRCHGNESMLTRACCETCLGLSSRRYSLLYATLYWGSAVLSLMSGCVIDRIGNRVSTVLFIILASLGCNLFALAGTPYLRNTSAMFPLMLTGRILLGFGNGPIRIVQNRVVSYWYAGDSYVAVGFVTLTRRLGAILNFAVTANIAVHFGFTWALFTGAMLCSCGILAVLAMVSLDFYGSKKLGLEKKRRHGHHSSVNRKIDCGGLVALAITTLSIPSLLMLAYCPNIPPVILTFTLGIIQLCIVTINGKITIDLVPQSVFGTVSGISLCVTRILMGLVNLAVGFIIQSTDEVDQKAYQKALLLMTAISTLAVSFGIILNILDIRNGDGVNQRFVRTKCMKHADTDDREGLLSEDIKQS